MWPLLGKTIVTPLPESASDKDAFNDVPSEMQSTFPVIFHVHVFSLRAKSTKSAFLQVIVVSFYLHYLFHRINHSGNTDSQDQYC
jgi:hypothetical protein